MKKMIILVLLTLIVASVTPGHAEATEITIESLFATCEKLLSMYQFNLE